jgi:hypothetical protein
VIHNYETHLFGLRTPLRVQAADAALAVKEMSLEELRYTYIYAHIHTYTYTYTHTYIYAYIHKHIHTHTYLTTRTQEVPGLQEAQGGHQGRAGAVSICVESHKTHIMYTYMTIKPMRLVFLLINPMVYSVYFIRSAASQAINKLKKMVSAMHSMRLAMEQVRCVLNPLHVY